MDKPKYSKEQLERARELFGIETPEALDEAIANVRELISVLHEWDETERLEESSDSASDAEEQDRGG